MEAGGENEKLKLDIVGEDREKTLGEALHGVILWCKAHIKLIGNTAAPVRLWWTSFISATMASLTIISTKGQEYSDSFSIGQRKETDLIPPTGWTPNKKQKIGPQKKLAHEMTDEELAEHTCQAVKIISNLDHLRRGC